MVSTVTADFVGAIFAFDFLVTARYVLQTLTVLALELICGAARVVGYTHIQSNGSFKN